MYHSHVLVHLLQEKVLKLVGRCLVGRCIIYYIIIHKTCRLQFIYIEDIELIIPFIKYGQNTEYRIQNKECVYC